MKALDISSRGSDQTKPIVPVFNGGSVTPVASGEGDVHHLTCRDKVDVIIPPASRIFD